MKYDNKNIIVTNLVNGTNKIAELVVVGPLETSSIKYNNITWYY